MKTLQAYAFLLILFTSFALTAQSPSKKASTQSKEAVYERLQSFVEVLDAIKGYYYEPVNSVDLVEGAIKGALNELDPHSIYFKPEEYKKFKNRSKGAFWGIGLELSFKKNRNLIVVSPIQGSPSWEAGILSEDQILSINGISVKQLTFLEISNILSSKEKSVDLLIERSAFKEPKIFKIKKKIIKVKAVTIRSLEKGYALLRVSDFVQQTSQLVEKKIDSYQKKNGPIKGLVLDIRSNPGGLLDQAVALADLFLSKGVIVSTKGRTADSAKVYRATGKAKYEDFPVVILQNRGSASASEVLAGALRENGRAFLVGEKSFGKGSVQSILELEDKSALKITVALFYTPKGHRIHLKGIEPDVKIKMMNQSQRMSARADPKKDSEVSQALSHLKLLAIHSQSFKKKK